MRSNYLTYCIGTISTVVLAVVMLALTGCNTSGCLDNQNSIPLAGFYDAATGDKISIDSLEIGGLDAPHDSLLTRSMGAVSQIYLPLRSNNDETTFYIRYCHKSLLEYGVEDFITFSYTSEPYLVSEECGAMFRYRITECKYTTNVIESVAILDSLVTNEDIERIKIYFRTSAEE